jgi:hypothetical protein
LNYLGFFWMAVSSTAMTKGGALAAIQFFHMLEGGDYAAASGNRRQLPDFGSTA